MQMTNKAILAVVVGLVAASSANASIEVTYDAAASTPSTGTYAFVLSGVPTTPVPTSGSTFELLDWTLVGNSATMVLDSAPSGWSADVGNTSLDEWLFKNTAGNVNGMFTVTATPNLNLPGTTLPDILHWSLAVPGISGDTTSGLVAVPEPGEYGLLFGVMGLAMSTVAGLRRNKSNIQLA